MGVILIDSERLRLSKIYVLSVFFSKKELSLFFQKKNFFLKKIEKFCFQHFFFENPSFR